MPDDDRDTIHTPGPSTGEMEAQIRGAHRMNFMKWAKLAGAAMALFSVLGSAWTAVSTVNQLHGTILANKLAVGRMATESGEQHDKLRYDLSALVTALRESRTRDQEVITNLRIAIATLQAAQGVRSGSASYTPGNMPGVTSRDPLAGLALANTENRPPVSAMSRRVMEESARQDSSTALERARRAQSADDPLASIDL